LASELIKRFLEFALESDVVLMAIAKTFPSGDYGQSYPLFSKGFMSLLVLRGLLTGEGNETISLTIKILSVVILMGQKSEGQGGCGLLRGQGAEPLAGVPLVSEQDMKNIYNSFIVLDL
ncbi:hypothetical protein Tco_1239092, partial [Tanacetum coccineum]